MLTGDRRLPSSRPGCRSRHRRNRSAVCCRSSLPRQSAYVSEDFFLKSGFLGFYSLVTLRLTGVKVHLLWLIGKSRFHNVISHRTSWPIVLPAVVDGRILRKKSSKHFWFNLKLRILGEWEGYSLSAQATHRWNHCDPGHGHVKLVARQGDHFFHFFSSTGESPRSASGHRKYRNLIGSHCVWNFWRIRSQAKTRPFVGR